MCSHLNKLSMSNIDGIISEFTDCEKRIMNIIGRLNASPNKNFTRQTVKKKASNEELPYVDEILHSFLNKQLIHYYRAPNNFACTKLGFNVAQKLKEESYTQKYGGMRILRR